MSDGHIKSPTAHVVDLGSNRITIKVDLGSLPTAASQMKIQINLKSSSNQAQIVYSE